MVVPFAPGGNADITGRALAPRLGANLGQAVNVENIPGGGGGIGIEHVVKDEKTGYTIGVGSNGSLILNNLVSAPRYDPKRDLTPIGLVSLTPLVFVAGRDAPARSMAEFIAQAKASPGEIAVGNSGVGTTGHLGTALLANSAGIEVEYVPYRSGGNAFSDLNSGKLPYAFVEVTTATQLKIEGNGTRFLGIGGRDRVKAMPDVPTFPELGVPGDAFAVSFIGLVVAAGSPSAAIAEISRALSVTLSEPAVQSNFESMGSRVSPPELRTSDGFARFLSSEIEVTTQAARLAKIVR
jgi:tripartite-type tricarboxylate transporter receptor subunit TctC